MAARVPLPADSNPAQLCGSGRTPQEQRLARETHRGFVLRAGGARLRFDSAGRVNANSSAQASSSFWSTFCSNSLVYGVGLTHSAQRARGSEQDPGTDSI